MPDTAPISVIYVDDEPALLDVARLFLERTGGFTVSTVTSGKEALAMLSSCEFDAIISDFQMPEMDGIEFLKHVRCTNPAIPFILFTGRGREEIVIQAINNGVTFYMQKGGDPSAQFAELAHKIRQAVTAVRAEVGLKQSEMLHRTIFNMSPEPIVLTNAEGVISYVSPASLPMFGLTSEKEALGTPIFDWIVPEKREEARKSVIRFMQSGLEMAPPSFYTVQRKDQSRFYAEISSSKLTDADGKPIGLVSILRDVTGRFAAEAALRKAGTKLNLLSSVTRHDILNRLTALLGYIELARQAKDPVAIQDFLTKIDEIAGMLGQQIEFTKDYQELGVHSPKWQSISAIIRQASAGLDLGEIKIEDECWNLEVYADPLLLKVMYNFMDNSLRHGGRVDRIRFHYVDEGNHLALIVEDNGEGVRVQDKEKIFEKGFGKNTGFGLFLVREILAITGMTIGETGFPGKGAQFRITIPQENYRFKKRV